MSADLVLRCRAEIDRLRKVEAAATPGPWETDGCEIYQAGTRDWIGETLSDRLTEEQDSEFIATARSFVPAMLDAFTAILDDEEDCNEVGISFPGIIRHIAAALGVGDQETQP